MIFSLEWLKDDVDLPWQPERLARELTLRSLEVGRAVVRGEGISGIVVGKIVSVSLHPHADRLKIVMVDVGRPKPIQIVCGGVNMTTESIGWNIVVALEGAMLNVLEIKKTTLRGVESQGMICSAEELGLPKEVEHGIIRLGPNLKPGADARRLLGFGDCLFDVDILANRGDCMSHEGLAREIAAISRTKLHGKSSKLPKVKKHPALPISVHLKDKAICPRYSALILSGVTIQDSPQWLKNRLQACGIRPISHIVDLTNYLMLDTGQPLHAFDASKISGNQMTVRASREHEVVTTLDGVERKLPKGTAIIEDDEKLIDLAGIMGGENSAIDSQTSRVVLQAAVFDPEVIRLTSRALGHRTEAVARYEKGVDRTQTLRVLAKAYDLLREMDHGIVLEDVLDAGQATEEPFVISWDPKCVERISGMPISEKEIRSSLTALGCRIEEKKVLWNVTVPSWRADLRIAEDLAEEVIRLVGYDKIPESSMPSILQPPSFNPAVRDLRKVRSLAASAGYAEVKHFSFASEDVVRRMEIPFEHHVEIANPLSAEHRFLRRELLSSILQGVQTNVRRQQPLRLFEVGTVYYPSVATVPQEERQLAVVMTDAARTSNRVLFDDVSGLIACVGDRLGRPVAMKAERRLDDPMLAVRDHFHPRHYAQFFRGDVFIGFIGQLQDARAKAWNAEGGVVVAEVNLDRWLAIKPAPDVFQDFSSFPPVKLEVALVVSGEMTVEALEQAMRDAGGEILRRIEFFDVYRGDQLPVGKKSLAFHLTYQSFDRTLTLEDAGKQHRRLLDRLDRDFGARLR
ncbi:MAG: phenylalanine--tRNA ligase subunit beta [Patescibacteria group bacterium]